MADGDRFVVLIAPNVSEQKGGEAIKALQIFLALRAIHPDLVQITHARNRDEISRLGLANVHYVEDTRLMRWLWKSRVFRLLIDPLFSKKAVALAESLARETNPAGKPVVVHQTEPNSPVSLRTLSRAHRNVFGPINGNIYYPPAFRDHESTAARLRRGLHFPLQRLNRWLPGGIKRADLIFCAGGERTRSSLLAAGCPDRILAETVDCGVPDDLLDRPRVTHAGENRRFVHFGRLVFHKCTALIIESVARSRTGVTLDVVGRGPELDRCRSLARELRVEDRVRFVDWYASREVLFEALAAYRAVVFPSIEDANGIVVQESMALGLPVVGMDWGGPQLLIDHGTTGFLIPPRDRAAIVTAMAEHMDRLATDGALAERMSLAAREAAQRWRWSVVAREWNAAYGA